MAVERYLAAAGLGLFVMFVGEIITLYIYMIDSQLDIEPVPKLLQFISIGVAPALIMSAVSFIMSKRYGSKPIGYMIIAGGAALLAGMAYTQTLVDMIKPEYAIDTVLLVPPLFMAASIPVMITGAMLLRIKKRRPKKEYV